MPEIMSAEELFLKIEQTMNEPNGYNAYEIETIIVSRDSAMLEKYKEATRKAVSAKVNGGDFLGKDNICIILDSTFAEINQK